MNAVPFDTLKLALRLEQGGFSTAQSRSTAAALAEAFSSSELATRADINAVKADISAVKADISALRTELKADISAVRAELKADITMSEQRVTIRLGGMMVVAVGVMLAAMRYFTAH